MGGKVLVVLERNLILADDLGRQTGERKDGTGQLLKVRTRDESFPLKIIIPDFEDIQRCDALVASFIQVCTSIKQQFGSSCNVR